VPAPGDEPVTPLALVPLRLVATAAHVLPGLRLRLRHGDRIVLDVARSPLADGRWITPCAFRGAVAEAHRQLELGVRLRFLELAEGSSPTIEVGVAPGDRVLPGGIYRVGVADVVVHAFATTLEPRTCRTVVAAQGGDVPDVRLHHDAATDVTLVHMVRPAAIDGDPRLLLEDLVAACLAEEVAAGLEATEPRGACGS
jgi:hypothetical protein